MQLPSCSLSIIKQKKPVSLQTQSTLNAGCWTRTSDPRFTIPMLYQLSYAGIRKHGNVLPSQGAIPQLLSALWSLTSVFGMGTGISSMPSSPHYFLWENLVLSKLDNIHFSFQELAFFWLSPRPISNGPLHASPHFHFHPIYLIISQGS